MYPLVNERQWKYVRSESAASGEMTLAELAKQVARKLDLPGVRLVGDSQKIIRKAAACGGAGSSDRQGGFSRRRCADNRRYKDHEAQQAKGSNSGLALLDAGHFGTEKLMVGKVAQYLQEKSGWKMEWEAIARAQSERDVLFVGTVR